MSIEASTLSIVVKSDGIAANTEALNKLAQAGDKAEKSTAKLAKANKGADAAAKQSEKVWYELLHKASQFYEKQYNMQQQHNNRLYSALQGEANKMNKAYDRQLSLDAANAARRRAQEQSQLEQLDVLRRNAAAKEYARAQAEANRMNSMLDRARKQQEAAAKASAERQRVLNSTYSTSSLAQQIQTLQRAQAYGNAGGNVTSRYGSNVAGAISSGELQRLQQQYRQLHNEANRANGAMRDTHAAVRGLSGSLGALWLTYGNILPLVAGAAVGAAIKGIVAVGKDIEHTLEKIRVLGQASTGEIDAMRKTVYELGQGVQGPRDVAEALSVLTLAGLKAEEALQGVRGALNLSIVGDIGIEQSAKTLVQVRTALGYTAADFDHIADVIAKTAAVSMSSVDSISGAFLSAAAVGEVYGASLQDIAVGLAAVANLGIQGTAAGTTLKNFYKDLSAGGEKATKVLKDMGLSMRDLKDEDGFFLTMDKLLPKLNNGFSTLNKLARPEAMDKLFGERGVKTGAALIAMINQVSTEVDALGNKYANKFEEVFDQINKAAAFSTLGAIAMAQTSTNQIKSVGNTLQTVLGKAFATIAPQIGDVAREMKKAFNSPEFMEGVKSLAIGVANLTKFLVTHLDVIGKVVLAYAAFKLTAFAAGLVEVAKGFTLASIGAKAFSLSLGPIAVAITAMAAAWAIYKANKDKALNNNSASSNLSEFADGVMSAAEKEKEALEMRQKGQSELEIARKAQMDADKEASSAAVKRSQQGLDAMKKQMAEEYASLSDYQKKRVDLVKAGKAQFTGDSSAQKYIEMEKGYNAALATHGNQVKIVTAATEALIKTRQKNGELADKAARQNRIKPTGDKDLTQAPDKEGRKLENFIKSETLEMSKAVAQYEAKNAALRESIKLGKIVQADSRQAAVLENLKAGKYGKNTSESNPVYQSQKALAAREDAAKAMNSQLKKLEEFANKLAETEAAQVAFNEAAADGSNIHIGALRKEAEGLIRLLSLSEAEAEILRKRADAMDSFRKQQEALRKLESAAANAGERAEAANEEAEAMMKYGVAAKLSAMQVAELLIQKRELTDSGTEAVANLLREKAATEQLNVSFRDLVKEQLELDLDLQDAQSQSLMIFGQGEAERVRMVAESQKKIAELKLANAQEAFDGKALAGTATFADVAKMDAANKAYEKTLSTINKIASVRIGNILKKEEVERWRDLGSIIENSLTKAFGKAGEAAGKMFNLFAQGQARELVVTEQIAAFKAAQAKDGIDRTKEINNLQHQNAVARISEYAGMTDAAKGFFSEGSRGYEAMTKASRVLHAAEVALSLIKGVNAILTQGSGDPYSAFARMAAMAAMVAALGVTVTGGGSGGGMSSQDKQSVQGTGSVLGSQTVVKGNKVELVGAKSESIANSLDILEKNSGLGLVVDNQMLNAMRKLSDSIGRLAVMVVRDSGISNPNVGKLNTNNGTATNALQVGTFAAIGAYFGPIGAAIGALVGILAKNIPIIGKIATSIFGGKQSVQDSGLSIGRTSIADALSQGVQATSYAEVKTSGGWFKSDKVKTQSSNLNDDINKQFTAVFTNMYDSLVAAADVIGVGGDDFTKRLQTFVIDVGQLSLKGLSGEEIEKEIQAMFSKVGDDFAKFAFADFQQYQKIGEGMLETVARVANEFAQVTDVFAVLGRTLPKGMESVAISQKIIEAFGDVEKLTSGVGDYMSGILTEKDRLDITTKSLAEGMARINLSSVTTKEGFKGVVEALDLTKESDIALFRSLMELAPLFAQVADAAADATKAEKERLETITSTRLELEGRIAELTKNTAEASRVLAAQRAIELSKLDESLHPLQQRVWLLEDEASVIEKNNKAMEDAVSAAETAYDRLANAVGHEKDSINKLYDDAIDAVRKKAEAEKEAAEKQLNVAERQRDAIKRVVDSLAGALKSTEVVSATLTKARRIEAQSYLQVAAIQVKSGGDITKLGGLNSALEAIAKPSEDLYATFEDYARDQAMTANVIENLYGSAENQLSAAELTISKLNATIEAIDKNSKATIEEMELMRKDEINKLDEILEKAQEELDAVKGVDSSIKELTTAMNNFAAMIAAAKGQAGLNAGGSNSAAIGGLYQSILGRAPDAAGAAFWDKQLTNGVHISAIADAINKSPEAQTKTVKDIYQNALGRQADAAGLQFWQQQLANGVPLSAVETAIRGSTEKQTKTTNGLPSFDVGTNFVPHDMVAQIHEGERIVPAADNSRIERALSSKSNDISELKAEIRSLKDVIISGDVAKMQVLKEHLRLEKKWDQDGMPEVRNVDAGTA